jgi:hypothetical protein
MEDSPTDTPDLWIPQRNEEDTMFASADVIPTKKHPQPVGTVDCTTEEKYFQRSGEEKSFQRSASC